ncbi:MULTISPECIES: hypothetical protein [Helicobacter]|nr:hypothetical protein [Helicobacter sp. UBA3407]
MFFWILLGEKLFKFGIPNGFIKKEWLALRILKIPNAKGEK